MTRLLCTLTLLLGALAAHAADIETAPLRIMCIGDSITEGSDGGYRLPLYQKLTTLWGLPNMVGHRNSRSSDPAAFTDNDHDGYSAYRIEQITSGKGFWRAPRIERRLTDWEPAIVTIHVGTNDAQQNYYFDGDAAQGIPPVIERLDDLVSRIVAYNPGIEVFVATIIPANPPASEQTIDYVRRFNALVPGLVARHQAAGHRVHLVDQYTPMLAYPNPDGIHPSAEGAQRMAEVWFEAIAALGAAPANFDPGRHWGVRQTDYWSRTRTAPWTLVPNLVREGSATLAATDWAQYGGRRPVAVLNDGQLGRYATDGDNQWGVQYTLNTEAAPQGYDIAQLRSAAGLPPAANGDEQAHQAFGIWVATVDAPQRFVRLGVFHHIMVSRDELGSQVVIDRADGQPLARRVAAVQWRFTTPPRRQMGVFGITNPAVYREVEVVGGVSD